MNKVIDREQRKVSARKVDKALRLLCTQHQITMVAFAQHLGIDRASLYEKLKGNGPLEFWEVEKIAEAFNLTAGEFLALAEEPLRGKRAPGLKARNKTWKTLSPAVAA